MNTLPFEIIYARKADNDVRESIVAIPVHSPQSKMTVAALQSIVGSCIEAYRLTIPYCSRNLVINNLEVQALLHIINRIASHLFDEKYPWKGKSNVGKKDIKQQMKELIIHTGGSIQKTIDDYFKTFQNGQERMYSVTYEAPIEYVAVPNDFGYHYFIIFTNGSVETESTLGDSASTLKQLANVPALIEPIAFSDPRLITPDSKVYDNFQRFYNDYYDKEIDSAFGLHRQFPWLKDFLLIYLSKVLQSIPSHFIQFIDQSHFTHLENQESLLESLHPVHKPNSTFYKETLLFHRKELLSASLQSKESKLSQIIQFILSNLDAVPINQTELNLFGSYKVSGKNYELLGLENEIENSIPSRNKKRNNKKLDSKKTSTLRKSGEHSSAPTTDDEDSLDYTNFLPASDELIGNEEMILSQKTQKKRKIASLIADSKRLHEMRINPVAQFRRENKNEKLPKLSLKNNLKVPNVKQYHQEKSYYADHLGDGMPDTAMAMSNLFGLHPLPKRKRVISQKSDISALSSSEEAGDVKIVNDYPDSVPFDPNPPNENLMAYVRNMAAQKMQSYLMQNNIPATEYSNYEGLFDSSALTTISIFIEETIKEMIKLWKITGKPLIFSKNSLIAEIYCQLNASNSNSFSSSSSSNDSTISVYSTETLKEILENLFKKNLDEYLPLIDEKRKEFIQFMTKQQELYQKNFPYSISSTNLQEQNSFFTQPYQIMNLSKRTVSVQTKDYQSYDSHLPISADAKRQIIGGKRNDYDNFPSYIQDYLHGNHDKGTTKKTTSQSENNSILPTFKETDSSSSLVNGDLLNIPISLDSVHSSDSVVATLTNSCSVKLVHSEEELTQEQKFEEIHVQEIVEDIPPRME